MTAKILGFASGREGLALQGNLHQGSKGRCHMGRTVPRTSSSTEEDLLPWGAVASEKLRTQPQLFSAFVDATHTVVATRLLPRTQGPLAASKDHCRAPPQRTGGAFENLRRGRARVPWEVLRTWTW